MTDLDDRVPPEVEESLREDESPLEWWENFAAATKLEQAKDVLVSAGIPQGELLELLQELHRSASFDDYPGDRKPLLPVAVLLTKAANHIDTLWQYDLVIENGSCDVARLHT